VVNGLVLAEDGKKMSKSDRNYTDPKDIINQFGADALRLFLMDSAVVRAEDLKYSDEGVREVLKTVIIPYWNAYSFFVTYANIDGVSPAGAPESPDNPLDRWVLSEAERLVEEVTEQLDAYELQKAIEPIVAFIDSLNNWYIRRSRRRFWKSENDGDKEQAYQTLYSVLMTLTRVSAPIVPFITEEIYRNLRGKNDPDSVHLTDYPVADDRRRDRDLERKMATTREAVSLGRAIRTMHNLKIRQPLSAIHLVTRDDDAKRILREMEDIIRDELNVKEVVFRENEEELVEYTAKANFRELGPRLGKRMRAAAALIEGLSGEEIQQLMDGSMLSLDVDGEAVEITGDSVIVQRHEKEDLKVLNEGALTVALDPTITDELRQEGLVRELIRGVQNLRKDSGHDVTDRIALGVAGDETVIAAAKRFDEYLCGETLTEKLSWEVADGATEIDLGDHSVRVSVTAV
jgi:isoleucyl-tRNA synthetase